MRRFFSGSSEALQYLWVLLLEGNAEVAMRTAFIARDGTVDDPETNASIVLRGLRKISKTLVVLIALMIFFGIIPHGLTNWLTLAAMVLGIVVTAVLTLNASILPVGLAYALEAAGEATTIQSLGTTFLPKAEKIMQWFRSIIFYETLLAFYVTLVPVHTNMNLFPILIMGTILLIIVGARGNRPRFALILAVLVISVTTALFFKKDAEKAALYVRDVVLEQSWLPFVSSPVDRDLRQETKDFVARDFARIDSLRADSLDAYVKRAEFLFEEALRNSDEEGQISSALMATCDGDVNCRRGRRVYIDSVLAAKRGNAATVKEATPVAKASASAGSTTENPNIVRIRETDSIPLLAEWYAIDYADGRYDSELGERLRALGADSSDFSRMTKLRRKCGFDEMPRGQIQRTTVYPGMWSSAFNLQGATNFKTCGEGDHRYDRRRDLDDSKIDHWEKPGFRTKHWSRWIQYRGLPGEEPYKAYALVIRRR